MILVVLLIAFIENMCLLHHNESSLRNVMEVQIIATKKKSSFFKKEVSASPKAVPMEIFYPLFELMFAGLKADQVRHEGEAKENE